MHDQQNGNWTIKLNADGTAPWDGAQLAVLMDIREELKALNLKMNVLRCPDFLAIPRKLDQIKRNTSRKKKRQPVEKGAS